jgi:muramidase (phage lysozyme)
MARISTGQAYGDTGRRTSQRLLGGAEVVSTPGVLAEQTINAPQLQPTAAPVNTFQQSGAPTLGGPVRMFAPPELPRPSQDMANLATALGSFNPVLKDIGEMYVLDQKRKDEADKQLGGTIATEASRYGTFGSFVELKRAVEKEAAAGNPAATNFLARLQSLDPRPKAYTVENLQDSAVKFNLATAKSKLDQARTLPDGTPIESLAPSDPRFQQFMTELVMPNGMVSSPTVFAANKASIYAMYGSLGADQAKRNAGWNTRNAKTAFSQSRQSNLALLESGQLSADDFALSLSTGLDLLYSSSGLTVEEYQKEKEGFLKSLASEAVSAAGGDITKLSKLGGELLNAIPKIQAGPNGELLLDQIGGMPALRDFYRQLMTGVAEDRELETKFDAYKGEDQADTDVAAALTPEVMASPAAFRQTTEALRQRATQLFPGDPDAQMAYTARVDKAIANREKAYIAPVRDETAAQWYSRFATDPNSGGVEDINAITQAFRNGELSEADYKSLVMTAGSRNREDNRANFQTLRGLQSDLKTRLEAQFQRGDSEGGAVLTPSESRQLWQAMGSLYRQGSEMIQKTPGQDLTGQLTQMYGDAVTKGLTGPQQQNKPPQGQRTPMPLEKTLDQLGRIEEGKGMDSATKETIRKSGMKPSDYYKWQLRQNGINNMTPEAERELRKLDQMSSISAPGTGGMGMLPVNRYADVGRKLASQFGDALVRGIFSAPAAAGEMPLATATRGSRPFTGDTGSNQVAARNLPPQTRALLRTIRFAEGTAHQDGYRTMFTGRKFNDLSRHPRQINRGNGFASDAAGAYQFLSTTWDSVMGGAMAPARQDLAAVKLIRNRGVDPRLPKGFTIQVADRLSPEWASFPTASTGTSYYGQGGKSYQELKSYYDRVLREEMARGR